MGIVVQGVGAIHIELDALVAHYRDFLTRYYLTHNLSSTVPAEPKKDGELH